MWRCAYHLDIHPPSCVKKYFARNYFARSSDPEAVSSQFSKVTISLPLDSIIVFICSITLVENFSLLPSYIFFSCGWALTAVLNWRQNHPDPWYQSIGFLETLRGIATGLENSPHNIAQDENRKSTEDFNDMWEKRFKLANERAAELAERRQKQLDEVALEMETFGNNSDLSSMKKSSSLSLNPKYHLLQILKPSIYPYQQQIHDLVEWMRFFRNVITWQEYYFSFYVSVACFTIAALSFFVPWAFISRWVARIVAWSLFGPWIALVKQARISHEEASTKQKEMELKMWEISKNTLVKQARISHEEASKKRSLMQYLFGQYMVKVPLIKSDRYIQRPLSSSTATPIGIQKSSTFGDIGMNIKDTDKGQHLTGNMIPEYVKVRTNEDTCGEQLLHQQQKHPSNYVVDRTKMSIILIISGMLTLVCVPMLIPM